MATNKKKVLASNSMGKAGWPLLEERLDVEGIPFPYASTAEEFQELLRQTGPVHAVVLGATRFGQPELNAAPDMQVVARVGVGYDAIDVPALSAQKVALMVAGTANSPSVAEQAVYYMSALAKRGVELDQLVKEGRWFDRLKTSPGDLFEKTVLIVGFGRIGTRTAKRCIAMEMNVLVHDPYVADDQIQAAGCEAVADLDQALSRADFVTIHCPKTPETVGMFAADRLARMKPTAFLINTARGGIVDEPALHAALTSGQISGAGIDVFASEPPEADNPLLQLPNVLASPHVAGVTAEAMNRMAVQSILNIFSVFDGKPIVDNVINREIYD